MADGVVKWFDSEKGQGVITVLGEPGRCEVHVHAADLLMNGYPTLDAGEGVSFFVERAADGGLHARRVTPFGGPPPAWLLAPAGAPPRARRSRVPLVLAVVAVIVVVAVVWFR